MNWMSFLMGAVATLLSICGVVFWWLKRQIMSGTVKQYDGSSVSVGHQGEWVVLTITPMNGGERLTKVATTALIGPSDARKVAATLIGMAGEVEVAESEGRP